MDRGGSLDGKLERAKDAALGPHDGDPTVADLVGEAAGGITGVLAGAAIGSLAGPVGTVIGGIAGALGGWWSGRAISEAVERLTEDDETYYRQHHKRHTEEHPVSPTAPQTAPSYDDVRPAYHLGHIAGMNPDYKGRRFEEIEADLQRGWTDEVRTKYGEWDAVRGYVEEGFNRRVGTLADETPRTGEPRPSGDAPSRGPDESTRGAGDRAPGGDSSAGDSSASKHRSIPRGTDESQRP